MRIMCWLVGLLVVTAIINGRGLCLAQPKVEFGSLTELRTDEGRISFGTIVSADVVAWSAPDAQDLLIARCWEGVFLYPSKDLQKFGEPIRLCDSLRHVILMIEPLDWDGDGRQEAMGTDREGKIFCLKRVGEYPDLRLEAAQDPLLTPDGLTYNIPFVNPKFRLSDQAEYIRPDYFNYTYPTHYSASGKNPGDLIVGDWGGALWYLPHGGVKAGLPQYEGVKYSKRDGKIFAKPKHHVTDENGEPLLLGEAVDAGVRYPGGAARPVMYRNESRKSDDLLVLCGMAGNTLKYLQRVKTGPAGEPFFKDLGEVVVDGFPDEGFDPFCYHAVVTTFGEGPWQDLLITRGGEISVCRNKCLAGPKPAFQFSHWISGKSVPTRGCNFTEILTDQEGYRYVLENDNIWWFRKLLSKAGKPQISSERHLLRDQNGVFQVAGETDATHGERWGFHRAALWDYDGSHKQHLIVGTDKGWLYLLREDQPLGKGGRFEFRSIGPLKNNQGHVIKVHNRVVAAPIDLDADGRLDLVLAGASYQMGYERDPHPGSGIYYTLNLGAAADGTPLLSPVRPLETIGHSHAPFLNGHAQLQSLDLLGNGERVAVVGTQAQDNFRGYVYRPAKDRIALEHTGLILPPISIEERLLDLDGDGDWEYLRSGGESLIARYAPVKIELAARTTTFQITVDRGPDRGQNFGSLFEVTSADGTVTIGAGFQNLYNTRTRADRHALQFFVRPTDGERTFQVEQLPRPNNLCGTYLFSRDEVVHSTFGDVKAWDAHAKQWRNIPSIGGTEETMRVGTGVLEFGDSSVKYSGRTILEKPARGSYQIFFYADGYLCFYHVDRGDGGYRPYVNDADGFSKLYACPWTPEQHAVDLAKAIVLTLPVVGETTFAWGQLGRQVVTGSNIGGFYVLEDGQWRKLLEPNISVSYQLYSSMAFHDRLLMGQYPTGRLFDYDGKNITDRPGWPPVLQGVTSSSREAQTTVIYGGEMFVGVWPWGELWRYNPDAKQWHFQQRMFPYPELSDEIVHPYDLENRGNEVSNLWGQRVTSLVTSGDGLFVSTSAKYPCEWQPERYPFLAEDKWKSYGSVSRLTLPGHLGANTAWTAGPTTFQLTIRNKTMSISEDGKQLAETVVTGPLAERLRSVSQLKPVRWGEGIYGRFTGPKLDGSVKSEGRP
ncbi:MAG: hypothetical protein EXS05_24760 [Planctomycetaceae bacterium]|nr:hypothetical protein [Planctomycetaceae bacterium]